MTQQTLLKRLKDSSKLKRTDAARQRNTVRVTADGHPRQVIVLSLSETIDNQEKPNESDNTTDDNSGFGDAWEG